MGYWWLPLRRHCGFAKGLTQEWLHHFLEEETAPSILCVGAGVAGVVDIDRGVASFVFSV